MKSGCRVYSLVCKLEPKHLISIELERVYTLEKEDVTNVHLHITTHIISVEENSISDVPAGHLCSTYRQYSHTHTYIHTYDCCAALRNISKEGEG